MQINTYEELIQFVRNDDVFKQHTHAQWTIIDNVLADATLCSICVAHYVAKYNSNDEGIVDEIDRMLLEDATA